MTLAEFELLKVCGKDPEDFVSIRGERACETDRRRIMARKAHAGRLAAEAERLMVRELERR